MDFEKKGESMALERGRGILMISERVKEGPLVLQRGGGGEEW